MEVKVKLEIQWLEIEAGQTHIRNETFLIARAINLLVNCILEQVIMVDVDFFNLRGYF